MKDYILIITLGDSFRHDFDGLPPFYLVLGE